MHAAANSYASFFGVRWADRAFRAALDGAALDAMGAVVDLIGGDGVKHDFCKQPTRYHCPLFS